MSSAVPRPGRLVLLIALVAGIAVVARGRPAAPDDPCATPLPWRIGEVDDRFELSETEFRQAVEEAVWVWEDAVGRQLFRYDPDADMAIDLVYDARADTHDRQREIGAELARLEEDVEWRRADLDRLRARLRRDSAAFHASPDEAKAERYRTSVERFNRGVDLYNAAARRHNETLEELEETGPSDLSVGSLRSEQRIRGGRIAGTRRNVTIAYVGSHSELILILTHELGHALGLGHVPDEGAVMAASYRHDDLAYPVRLRPPDLDALERLCQPPD